MQVMEYLSRRKGGLYIYELFFWGYLLFFWFYMVYVYGLYATLQETFWENAVCRLPGLLIAITAGWMTTVYVCEQNRVDLNRVFRTSGRGDGVSEGSGVEGMGLLLLEEGRDRDAKSPEPSPSPSTTLPSPPPPHSTSHDSQDASTTEHEAGSVLSSYKLTKLVKMMVYTFCLIHLADLMTTGNYEISVVRFDLHLLLVVLFFIGMINPFDAFYARSRLSLLTALSDVLFSPWALASTSFFHVLIADYLTSISKILADVQVMICLTLGIALNGLNSASWVLSPDHKLFCYDNAITPVVISYPFLVRFVQCSVSRKNTKNPVKRRRYALGMFKYSISIIYVFLSALKRHFDTAQDHYYFISMWLPIVLFNSLFSFWYDIRYDWGIVLPLRPVGSVTALHNELPYENTLLLPNEAYVSAPWMQSVLRVLTCGKYQFRFAAPSDKWFLFMNVLGRISWAMKLSMPGFLGGEFGVWAMEVLEIWRRAVWAYLRLRWEHKKILVQEQLNAGGKHGDGVVAFGLDDDLENAGVNEGESMTGATKRQHVPKLD